MPRSLDLGPNGNFVARIMTSRLPAGNRLSFPKLTLTHDGFTSRTVSLDAVGPQADVRERDEANRLVVLKPIRFSPSSRTRRGGPSGSASSSERMAGSQYCRMRLPIGVPGPIRHRYSLSALLSIRSILTWRRVSDGSPVREELFSI